jgi:hypothetical protein
LAERVRDLNFEFRSTVVASTNVSRPVKCVGEVAANFGFGGDRNAESTAATAESGGNSSAKSTSSRSATLKSIASECQIGESVAREAIVEWDSHPSKGRVTLQGRRRKEVRPNVERVVLGEIEQRLIDDAQLDFGGNRLTVRVGHAERNVGVLAWTITCSSCLDGDVQQVFLWIDYEFRTTPIEITTGPGQASTLTRARDGISRFTGNSSTSQCFESWMTLVE